MPIITGVPTSLRRPQTFHRFTYQQGGKTLTPLPQRTVLIGTQKAGTGVVSTVYQINDANETDALFGVGSSLALMCRAAFNTCALFGVGPQLYAVPVLENAAGTARAQTFTLTGPATASGNLVVRIAGRTIVVPVALGDSNLVVAAALNVAINAMRKDLPGTSGIAGAVVTFTATHKGDWGADIVFETVSTPAGIGCVTVQSVAGGGVCDETAALAAIAGTDYDTIALENHKAADIALALTHVTTCWGMSEKKWRWLVLGETGSIGTATALASAANDRAIIVGNVEGSPSLPAEVATAIAIAITSRSRPNANWDGLQVPIFPPYDALDFTNTEIESALVAGLTPLKAVVNPTTRVQRAGVCAISKMVTTQTTFDGQPFEVLRDLAVSRAGAFVARQIDAKFAERFGASANPDGVLLDEDGVPRIKDMISDILYACQDGKIVTNVENDLALLLVEKDSSAPGRINVDVTYTVVLGLHQVAFVHRVTI